MLRVKKAANLKWTDDLAAELNKPIITKFRKRKVHVRGIAEIWAADLVDAQSPSKFNNGIKYLLTVTNFFKTWLYDAFETEKWMGCRVRSIFNDGKTPKKIWVDKGEEFYNKYMKWLSASNVVLFVFHQNAEKPSVVER